MSRTRLIAGCMTGTSIDSIDAALVYIEGEGVGMTARFVRGVSEGLGSLTSQLRELAEQVPMSAGQIAELSRRFSLAHIPVLQELLGQDKLDLIAVHGQTVYHRPPASWQLITPAVIAHALKAPVVFDLRAADLAAGGQGAPITPLADSILYRTLNRPFAVANLGGFCNMTLVGSGPLPQAISGGDVCPCNHLLDTIARRLFGSAFDTGGERASRGEVNSEALEDLDGILTSLQRSGRSLGTGDETVEWVSRHRSRMSGEDLAATACEGIASTLARSIPADCQTLVLAGGGVRNRALRIAIESCCSCRVQISADAGIPAEYREAACFAVLGALSQDRVPVTLPRITNVPEPAPLAGCWVFP
jgi:1,6-anhydro-N-acetylmuramate kinase